MKPSVKMCCGSVWVRSAIDRDSCLALADDQIDDVVSHSVADPHGDARSRKLVCQFVNPRVGDRFICNEIGERLGPSEILTGKPRR